MTEIPDFPNKEKVADVLLALIGLCGCVVSSKEAYDPVAKFFELSSAHLSYKTPTGVNFWQNRVQWSRDLLAKQGLIERPLKSSPTITQWDNKGAHGVWKLTPDGERAANKELLTFGEAARARLQDLAATIIQQRYSPLDDF